MRLPRNEADAWTSCADLLDLPEAITQAVDRYERLGRQLEAANADPAPDPQPVAALALAGHDDPTAEHERQTEAAQRDEDTRDGLAQARRSARFNVKRLVQAHRVELITDHLRPALDALLDTVTEHVDTLAPFAPDYDETALLSGGTDDQVDAWRDTRPLAEQFARLVNCWITTWRSATAHSTHTHGWPGHLRIDAPGGVHAWKQPTKITDLNVRDGRDSRLLSVAKWRDVGGWRLATGPEVEAVERNTTLEYPWGPGERKPRRVLLPVEAKQPVPERHRAGKATFY